MTAKAKQLYDEALKLPPDELAGLVNDLCEAVGDFADPKLAAEWDAEIAKRIEDIDSGRVKMIPWDVVRKELEEKTRATAKRKRSPAGKRGTDRGSKLVRRSK